MAEFDYLETKKDCDEYLRKLLYDLNYWDGSEFETPDLCKDYLSYLFNALTYGDDLANGLLHKKALKLMEKFPAMAIEKFPHLKSAGAAEWRPDLGQFVEIEDDECFVYPPLWWFVATNADHALIVKLYNIFPGAVSFGGGICFLTACRKRSLGNETLLFLLQKYPEVLTSREYRPTAAIQDIICGSQDIGGKFPFETIKAFMEVSPEVHGTNLGLRAFPFQFYPLTLALKIEDIDPRLLRYLTENFPKNIDRLQLKITEPDLTNHTLAATAAFSISQSKALVSLLPQLRQLKFDPSNLKLEGLICLLDALPSQTKLEILTLSFGRNIMNDETLRVLETSLSKNTSIISLSLTLPRVDAHHPVEDDELLKAISAGVSEMKQLKSCYLTGFALSQNGTLASFIANGTAPSNLFLGGFVITDESWPATPECYQACRVETFGLEYTKMKDAPLRQLCKQLPCMPLIQNLCISYSTSLERRSNTLHPPVDLTAPLIRLLRDQKLRVLCVIGETTSSRAFTANMEILCEELRTNKSLKHFTFDAALNEDWQTPIARILAESNDTLKHVMTPDGKSASGDEIEYWTRLNRAGRQKARDPSLSRKNFVELLCGALPRHISGYPPETCERNSFNTHFGLLRELPSLWSTMPPYLDEGSEANTITKSSKSMGYKKKDSGKKRKRGH